MQFIQRVHKRSQFEKPPTDISIHITYMYISMYALVLDRTRRQTMRSAPLV